MRSAVHLGAHKTAFVQNADWGSLLHRISGALGVMPKTFFFEDYIANPKAQIARFSGIEEDAVSLETRRDLRSSMSREAVAACAAIAPHVDAIHKYRRAVAAIEKALPVGAQNGRFDPQEARRTRHA